MIDRAEFAAGMTAIGIAVRQAPDPATLAVYHDVLGHHVDADEWRGFVRWGLEAGRWTWLPKLRDLQDALREFRGDRPLLVEATDAYERVLEAGNYTPEGTTWDYRSIQELCGDAAAEAFLAAGGNAAFANTFRESDRREKFVAAYGETVREDPNTKLLPAGAVKALPSADTTDRPITRDEASRLVRQVEDHSDVETPRSRRLSQDEWDARRRALQQQAAELAAVSGTGQEADR